MNREIIISFLILIIFVIATFIIVKYSNWQTALGIFLFVTANNLERSNRLLKETKKD